MLKGIQEIWIGPKEWKELNGRSRIWIPALAGAGVLLAAFGLPLFYSLEFPAMGPLMDTVILIVLNLLPIAVILALWPWFKRWSAEKKPPWFLSNVVLVTMMAALALLGLLGSHFPMYIKVMVGLGVAVMWFMAYRFREQGPVVGAVLVGLAAIMLLAG